MKRSVAIAAALLLGACTPRQSTQTELYLDDSQPIEVRVEDALARMTLDEKIALIHAQSKFSSPGVPRLGIPEVWMSDGPHGIRPEVKWNEWRQAGWTDDACTAFPALTCLAATWNRDMASLYGRSIGEEARYRRKTVLLGPGVNIYRTPLCGRNFEYMGEDPCLSATMVVPYIKGVQSVGVATCVKHFALNNQEQNRHTADVTLDDRALYEIYLPAFKAAVTEGDSWAIMGSYNLYKGQHCCHNQYLINDILRGEWGYEGVVVSDWGGTHSTEQAIDNGLDMEFGTHTDGLESETVKGYDAYYLADAYKQLIVSGKRTEKELDQKVRRVLTLSMKTDMNRNRPFGSFASPEHAAAARQIACEGIVLLKNDNAQLPIADGAKIVVVGENAVKMMTVGGGSSSLKAKHEVVPLEGIKARFGEQNVSWVRGYVGDTGNEYNGVQTGQSLDDDRSPDLLIAEAVEAVAGADRVIFVGGLNKSDNQDCESTDRNELGLPYGQNEVIEALAAANPNLTVVIVSGNAVAMPWIDSVPAVVEAWYGGSEAGNALADILSGDCNPSGKLPFTFPVRLEDNCASALDAFTYADDVEYKEGIFVGYRWHEKQQIAPLFPFGHGLSYTTFDYGTATLSKATITRNSTVTLGIDVTNSGTRDGSETVQLYIGDDSSTLPRPVKELKEFCKVRLKAGETRHVQFTITPAMLCCFDDKAHSWQSENGTFTAYVASSSADIRSSVVFELK